MKGRRLENKTLQGRTLVGRTLGRTLIGRSLPNRSAQEAYKEQTSEECLLFTELQSIVGIGNFKVYKTEINQFHREGEKIILGVYAPHGVTNYMHIYTDDFVRHWGNVDPVREKVLATYHYNQLIGIVKQSELQLNY